MARHPRQLYNRATGNKTNETVLHVRYQGRSRDVALEVLNITAGSPDQAIVEAVASFLDVGVHELRGMVIERHANGNLTMRAGGSVRMTSERPDPLALIAKMAQEEKKLSQSLFLAPVVAGGSVRVRLDGVIYEMQVEDRSFEGWALLQSTAPGRATVAGTASAAQISQYLRLLPKVRLILLDRFKNRWYGLQASAGEKNFQINGPVPLNGVKATASLDTVYARFDGANFWFESIDRRREPQIARSLRQQLKDDVKPAAVHCNGMVPQELMAYALLWMDNHPELAPPAVPNRRGKGAQLPQEKSQLDLIKEALAHAGAELDTFWNAGARDQITVRFTHKGRTHTATVNANNFTLHSAGVCLQGQDQQFDLTTLVGILDQYERNHGQFDHDEY